MKNTDFGRDGDAEICYLWKNKFEKVFVCALRDRNGFTESVHQDIKNNKQLLECFSFDIFEG